MRRKAAEGLRGLGLPLRDPCAPRSEEDQALHVNEHSLGDLRRFFKRIGWEAEIRAQPNYKLMVDELYGKELPPDFPMRQAPAWKTLLFKKLLLRSPVGHFLAREFLVLAKPGGGSWTG